MSDPQTTISVVDDDASFRESVARLLKAMGYEVRTFSSVDEYQAAGEYRGCLVLDVHMPGRSGLTLLRTLAARQPRVPVVFVTADDTPRVGEEATRAGAVACLTKPVASSDLRRAIERALAGSGGSGNTDLP